VLYKLDEAKGRAGEAKGRVTRVGKSVTSLATQARRLEGILKDSMANAAEARAAEAAVGPGIYCSPCHPVHIIPSVLAFNGTV
jgi:hypothetical protein